MTKNTDVVPPITPGEAPKKDNTLKIVIICLIIFIGLPMLAIIVIMVLVFSVAGGFINHAINEYGTNVTMIERSSGESVDSDYADSLSSVYDVVSGNPSAYALRSDCGNIESFIITETDKNFTICGAESFKSYAFENEADDSYVLGFYGIGSNSDYVAEITFNQSFTRYYNITIRKNHGLHDSEAVLVNYGIEENLPIEDLNPDADSQNEVEDVEIEDMQLDRA